MSVRSYTHRENEGIFEERGGSGGAPTLSWVDPLSIAVLEASRVASEPSAVVTVGVGALMGEKGWRGEREGRERGVESC